MNRQSNHQKANTLVSHLNEKPAFLTVENISMGYGADLVVHDLSFTLAQGEIGCLLGGSGCGKTTVLRAIAGLEDLQAGSISLDSKKISTQGNTLAPAKRQIGMVFQDYALFAHLSVAENVGFGLGKMPTAEKAKKVAEMLALVGLSAYAKAMPSNLSGGQQQRVALARALAPAPKLLLLDEPFSNLDIHLRESLATSVRDILKATHTTAILVTHDQHEAFAMADKVGVMQHKKLCQWATPEVLYHEPNSIAVANFIGEGVLLDAVLENGVVVTNLGRFQLDDKHPLYQKYANPQNNHLGGIAIKLLIRPDDIVHDDDSEHTATVVKRVFRGSSYLYTLALSTSDGHTNNEVLSLIPSHHDHAIGEAIGIVPMLDHLVVFEVNKN